MNTKISNHRKPLIPVHVGEMDAELEREFSYGVSQGWFEASMANDTSSFYLLLFIHGFLDLIYFNEHSVKVY